MCVGGVVTERLLGSLTNSLHKLHTTNGEGQDQGSKRSTKITNSLRVQERDLEEVALELALQEWNMDNQAQLPLLSPSANTTEVAPEEIGNLGHTQCSDGSNPEMSLLDIIFFSPVW